MIIRQKDKRTKAKSLEFKQKNKRIKGQEQSHWSLINGQNKFGLTTQFSQFF